MKPWQISTLTIIGVFFIILLLPVKFGEPFIILVIISSAIWTYIDAKKLNIGKYKNKKTFLSLPASSPFGVAALVWLFWILAFPIYISYRKKIIDGEIPLKEADSQKINDQGADINTENNN